eukprot:TRINITY_DN1888_c0_g1_i2.p1 TRINITY_DN1888_c0_g1~~TRINITY_DN1888_c0_g1_i2.p1  ORF type:complete len:114 (+),score=15.30 TRINITY_DN1888_c0_g1_i2:239-580(+)
MSSVLFMLVWQAAETERRRNLTDAQRDAEDKADKDRQYRLGKMQDKKKWGFMQKYYHKGAFFQVQTKSQLQLRSCRTPTNMVCRSTMSCSIAITEARHWQTISTRSHFRRCCK